MLHGVHHVTELMNNLGFFPCPVQALLRELRLALLCRDDLVLLTRTHSVHASVSRTTHYETCTLKRFDLISVQSNFTTPRNTFAALNVGCHSRAFAWKELLAICTLIKGTCVIVVRHRMGTDDVFIRVIWMNRQSIF